MVLRNARKLSNVDAQSFQKSDRVCAELAPYKNNSELLEGIPDFWNNVFAKLLRLWVSLGEL